VECDFCHRNEYELKNIFSPFLDHIDKKVHLSNENINDIINKLNETYGFSLATSDKLSKIDKILLNMPIKLVFGDAFSFFLNEYPILKYIQRYYYDIAEMRVSIDRQLNELLTLYSQELSKELIDAEIKKQTTPYEKMMKDIEEKSSIFYRADNITKIKFNIFDFEQPTIHEIHDNFNFKTNFKTKNIILCSYCAYIFTGGNFSILDSISSNQHDKTQQQSQFKPKMIYDLKPLCEYFGVMWPNPDEELLKTNYRKMLTEYHPDKVDSLGIELRNLAVEKTKEITTNYKRLENIIKIR
jgi:hypothetical protein